MTETPLVDAALRWCADIEELAELARRLETQVEEARELLRASLFVKLPPEVQARIFRWLAKA